MSIDLTQLTDKQKKKLQKLSKLVEQGDVAILEHLWEMEEMMDEMHQDVKNEVEGLKNVVEPRLNDVLDKVRGKDGKDGLDGEKGEKGDFVKGDKGDKGNDGKDGKNGKDGKDGVTPDVTLLVSSASKQAIEAIKPLIPTIDAIEQDLPKLGEKIRDGLELLEAGEKLKIEAIEDLRKELDELKKQKNRTNFVGGGSSSGGRIVQAYDLTSQLNGVLKSFTLPAFWRVISVHSSSFPFVFRPTTDYTVSGTTITFTSEIQESTTLSTGQTLIVVYAE